MPTQVYIVPVDPGTYEVAGATRQQMDVADEIGVVFAILQAAAAGNDNSLVQALKADAAGNLRVTMAGQSAAGRVWLQNPAGTDMFSTTWADGNGAVGQTLPVISYPLIFNGVNSNRARDASAANLAAQLGIGAALTGEPGEWAVTAGAALGSASSASRAAGAAGVRHICQGYSIIVTSQAAPAAGTLTINLRDGATGAGTILEGINIQIPAALYAPIVISRTGLNIVGSAATAMTLESSAAYAAVGVSVAFEGYDAS